MSPRRKRTIPPEIAHVLSRLKLAIQGLGYSLRDIEKRLKTSDGYLSRVFLGTIELKMEHIIGIAKALQMAPEELMAFVYPTPKDPISPAAYQLWRRVGGAPPVAASAVKKQSEEGAVRQEDVDRILRQSLGRVFGDLANRLGRSSDGD
jgi:transcriptional regulator with XRE-family HTH domain